MVADVIDAPVAPRSGNVRRGLVWAFRRIIGLYFRDIEATGAMPDADTGGRVFVSNHMNGLVDPIMVITSAACSISPLAKSTLWKIPGLSWLLDAVDAVPIVRRKDDPTKATGSNDEIFDKVASSLAGGHNILIFPEGTSHNEPMLLDLKTGAARMLARAKERGGRGLTFQAVAIEFDDRDHFRSRCLLVYGPVRRIDEVAAKADDLVAAVTETMRDDLSELLVEGATWPERRLIARVAEMVANDAGDVTLEAWNAVGRRVEAARKALRDVDEATVAEIHAAVDRYYDLLASEGLADDQLAKGAEAKHESVSLLALAALAPLAAAGAALYAIPYQLPRFVTRAKHTDADEVSTLKLGVGLLVYPIWAGALIGGGFVLLPAPAAAGFAALTLVSPFAALAWLDAVPQIRRAIRMRRRGPRLDDLRAARDEAMQLVRKTQERLGIT